MTSLKYFVSLLWLAKSEGFTVVKKFELANDGYKSIWKYSNSRINIIHLKPF